MLNSYVVMGNDTPLFAHPEETKAILYREWYIKKHGLKTAGGDLYHRPDGQRVYLIIVEALAEVPE